MNDLVAQGTYTIVLLKNRSFLGLKNSDFKDLELLALYYQEYYGNGFEDLSFFLVQNSSIISVVLGYKIENNFCWPLGDVEIHSYDRQTLTSQHFSTILFYIEKHAKENGCQKIIIKDFFRDGKLSLLGEKLFNSKYHAQLKLEMEIEYQNFSEEDFRRGLRKSYKSLINWGKKNLKMVYINKDNLYLDAFQTFKDFHFKIAGRITRSEKTWQAQYEIIKQGFGELILAYYEDKLVAGSLFVDYYDTSIYFTGVYERDLFEFGISHSLLYEGICRSHKRGNTRRFSLGYFDTDIQDPKWYNIQFFKKGFCKDFSPRVLWSKEVSK